MRILLDTSVFLWFIEQDPKLSMRHVDIIRDPANEIFVSPVSIWECIIKNQLGKLPLPKPAAIYLPEKRAAHNFSSLPVTEFCVLRVATLPTIHRDPFDRVLIAQALQHNITFASQDAIIQQYPVPILQ